MKWNPLTFLRLIHRQITSRLEMPVEPQAVQNAPHLWRPSPPPKEDWEAEAGEQKWEYEGIVNEEVDVYGTTRCACIVPSQGYYGDERMRFAIVQLRGKLGTVSQLTSHASESRHSPGKMAQLASKGCCKDEYNLA